LVDATRPEVANGAGFDRSMQQNQDDNPVLGAIMNRNAPPAPSVAPAPRQFSDATASDLSGLLGMGYLTGERVMVADASGAVGIGLRGGSLKLSVDPSDSQPEDDYLRSELKARRSADDDLANAIAELKGRLFNDELQAQTQRINAQRQQFEVTDSQALSSQILGGLHGIAAFGIDSLNGTVRAIGNVTLGLGDFLTLGVNHDNPTIQQANIENRALLSGLYNTVTSPRETMTNGFEAIAAREAQARALDASRNYAAAAALRANTASGVAATVLGVGGSIKGVSATVTGTAAETNYILFNKTHAGSLPRPKGDGPNGGALQSHHGLQQQWAKENLQQYGYDPQLAPTITIESGKGLPHSVISQAQNARRDARLEAGIGKWGSSLQDELGYVVDDMSSAGFHRTTIDRTLDQQYRMLDKLGVPYRKLEW
jgi:hypothetical protein